MIEWSYYGPFFRGWYWNNIVWMAFSDFVQKTRLWNVPRKGVNFGRADKWQLQWGRALPWVKSWNYLLQGYVSKQQASSWAFSHNYIYSLQCLREKVTDIYMSYPSKHCSGMSDVSDVSNTQIRWQLILFSIITCVCRIQFKAMLDSSSKQHAWPARLGLPGGLQHVEELHLHVQRDNVFQIFRR